MPRNADRLDMSVTFQPVNIAVMTVSDTRTEADDKSGSLLVSRIEEDGHVLAAVSYTHLTLPTKRSV